MFISSQYGIGWVVVWGTLVLEVEFTPTLELVTVCVELAAAGIELVTDSVELAAAGIELVTDSVELIKAGSELSVVGAELKLTEEMFEGFGIEVTGWSSQLGRSA